MTYDPIRNQSDRIAIEQGYYFDQRPADKVIKFLETVCVQSKHPWTGKPLTLLPWQIEEIIYPIYGWFRPDCGPNGERLRRFDRAIIYCPKKVGKTTLLAGLSLYHLFEYPGSEVYAIAADINQSSVLYNQAADFVELGPLNREQCELDGKKDRRLWVRRHIKTIEDQKHKSIIRVLSSNPDGKSGFSANAVFYDELAEWNATHARTIWDRLVNAGMARVNSLQVVISTAQFDRSSLGYEQFRYAQDIKDNKIQDLHCLPVIYSLPDDADWTQEEEWWPVCPSLNHTVSKQQYREEYKKAKNSPSDETRFRTFWLNQWVGQVDQWVQSHKWAACKADFQEEELYGSDCIVGIDMARRYDLASYCLVIQKDDLYYLLPRFFIPAQLAKHKEKEDHVKYTQWSNKGYVVLTDGDVIDPSVIRKHLIEDSHNFRINEVRFDPYGFEESRQMLEKEGFNMVEITQNHAGMSAGTNHFERLILDNRIRHPDNPCLNWCMGNVKVKIDPNDRIMLDKMRSRGRIDGVVAAAIAMTGLLEENTEQWLGWIG